MTTTTDIAALKTRCTKLEARCTTLEAKVKAQPKITVAPTAPLTPVVGDVWVDSDG